MTLNEIFRRSGEPTYYTPMAVVGQLVNQEGGTVVIGNPPFSVEKPRKRKWIKKWHAFGLFFAVSNGRIKKRDERRIKGSWESWKEDKESVFNSQGHKCAHCGQEFESFRELEAHHILPWGRFPELRNKPANLIMLCHRCHKEVHNNPFKNLAMMKAKAAELGIDLKERYDGASDCEVQSE